MNTNDSKHEFSDSISKVAEMFSERYRKYGDRPECAEHSDLDSQERRMRFVCEVADLRDAKVLDFGCATGHMLTFLKREFDFAGSYVGYDISPVMIEAAQEKFGGEKARFEVRDILSQGVDEEFDYVLISGTFNDLTGDNWGWMTAVLRTLFAKSRVALAFNTLTRYVDYLDDHLFYVDPTKVFQFCKEELSPKVSLRHDYCIREGVVPYEFTTYVYATDIDCRKLNLT